MIDYLSYIPKSFRLGAQEYEVIIEDNLPDDIYGDYSYTPAQIRIARFTGDERIPEEQLAHCEKDGRIPDARSLCRWCFLCQCG